MKQIGQFTKTSAFLLSAILGCTLLLSLDAIAKVDQGSQLTPTGNNDSCCGDKCGGSCQRCCDAVCCPKRVTEEVKKHCWKVNPELVCIPGFRWPWERCSAKNPNCGDRCTSSCLCCKPKCGKVRYVNVLEKHEYTCKECGYEWEVKSVRTEGRCCKKGDCCCPSCGSGCASSESPSGDVQLAAGEETATAQNSAEASSSANPWSRWLRRK